MIVKMEMQSQTDPQYEIHFLDVGDADCIVIWYRPNAESRAYIALIDAGNASDATRVKDFLKNRYSTTTIDLAVCTHPDSDHKGGFFGLLEDETVKIKEFWWKNPAKYLSQDDFAKIHRHDSMVSACERVYNHPTDPSKNMLDLARKDAGCECYNVRPGCRHSVIPIMVLGPLDDYYRKVAIEIVEKFAELKTEVDTAAYDELEELSEENAKSVIDTVKDESPTNKGSVILYFAPTKSMRFLLAGDAAASSLRLVFDRNKSLLTGAILKVPHHGSKHNLNSSLINDLQPSQSVVSAAGTKKHPSSAIVYYLSKYGNVYSTHKTRGLHYSNRHSVGPAVPLKRKITSSL